MNINDLIKDGTVRIAMLPPGNPESIEGMAALTLPLLAEDYPAKTAIMWNAVYRQFGIPDRNCMLVASTKDIGRIITVLRSDNRYRGGGVGIGFKEVAMTHLDEVTPLAQAIGAVNIIKKLPSGRLIGDNTDGVGYALSLERIFAQHKRKLKGAKILILGAGGSGRAIAFALAEKGAWLTILNRTEQKAKELAHSLNSYFSVDIAMWGGRPLIPNVLPQQDAVVSVIDDAQSPLDEYSTLGDMELPITPESIQKNREQTMQLLLNAKPDIIVSDIRIRKSEIPMLTQARRRHMTVLDGIPMVVNQGVRAFWWLYQNELEGREVVREDIEDVMRSAVSE